MANDLTQTENLCAEELFQRVAGDLSMIADRELEVVDLDLEILDHRAAGEGQIHISFRLGFETDGHTTYGCLLMPLPDAVTLAGSLMMVADDVIDNNRKLHTLDSPSKDAMLEVGNFIGGASDSALRALELSCKVSFQGCQGVRADVRPALPYTEGTELVTARAKMNLDGYGESLYLLLLPREICSQKQAA